MIGEILKAASADTEPLRKHIAELEAITHAFRNADAKDWQHLDRLLGDSGHGRMARRLARARVATRRCQNRAGGIPRMKLISLRLRRCLFGLVYGNDDKACVWCAEYFLRDGKRDWCLRGGTTSPTSLCRHFSPVPAWARLNGTAAFPFHTATGPKERPHAYRRPT